jgi:ATP-binding cassette subfamily C (CFTR/MRP) protein 1
MTLCLVVNWANPGTDKTKASVPCATITLVAYLILPLLSYAEHKKTIRPPVLLNGYLFVSLLCDIVHSRTLWLRSKDKIAGNFSACVALKFVILILEAVGKRHLLTDRHQTSSPEATSGIYSRSFFWWLNPLFLEGSHHTFSLKDLYSLDKHLLTKYTHTLLDTSWNKAHPTSTTLVPNGDTHDIVPTVGSNKLFWATIRAAKWPLLSAIFPRLCLTALNFCQPFLLNLTITFSQKPINQESTNSGYGLIGAYFFVYTGVAVCSFHIYRMLSFSVLICSVLGIDRSISTSNLPRNNNRAGWTYINALS